MSGDISGHQYTVLTCDNTIPDKVLLFDRSKIGLKYFLSLVLPSFYHIILFVCFAGHFHGENQIFGFGAKFEFGRKFHEPTPISPDIGRNRKIRDDEDTDSTFLYAMQKTV